MLLVLRGHEGLVHHFRYEFRNPRAIALGVHTPWSIDIILQQVGLNASPASFERAVLAFDALVASVVEGLAADCANVRHCFLLSRKRRKFRPLSFFPKCFPIFKCGMLRSATSLYRKNGVYPFPHYYGCFSESLGEALGS